MKKLTLGLSLALLSSVSLTSCTTVSKTVGTVILEEAVRCGINDCTANATEDNVEPQLEPAQTAPVASEPTQEFSTSESVVTASIPTPTTVASAESSAQQNRFNAASFPLNSCGEPLPRDPSRYPINFYPVFIEHSDRNLSAVRSQYCGDAYPITRLLTNERAIQVASFSDYSRARDFSAVLQVSFDPVDIGEPRLITAPPQN